MRPGPAVRLVVAPVVALALAAGVAGWASGREPDTRSSLSSALDALPGGTLVAGFTDWSAIRADLGLGSASTSRGRAALTDDASLRDLTTRSVLGGLISDMHSVYGWSAADLDWESYGQAPNGAVMVARFSGSVSIPAVRKRLGQLGYTRRAGVWTLPESTSSRLTPDLVATLGNLAIDERRRLVVAADRPAYVPTVLATIRGSRASALSDRPLADVASVLTGSDTALIQSGDFSCRQTSLADQDADVRAQADAAQGRAGDLVRPTFTGRGLTDGRPTQSIRFVAAFDSTSRASEQARVRAALATGPFIGRSGRVEDTLALQQVGTDGSVSILRFDVDADKGAYMSGEGPLLFAGCP